jgi:hypothetical protein
MCSFLPLRSHELVTAVCQDPHSDIMQLVDVDIDSALHACWNLLVVDAQLDTSGFAALLGPGIPVAPYTHAAETCLVLFIPWRAGALRRRPDAALPRGKLPCCPTQNRTMLASPLC